MSRYEFAEHPNGDFAVEDTVTGWTIKAFPSFNEAMRLLAMLNGEAPVEKPTPPCCDCREKLTRTERACDLYRVALAQIQRTTSDTETAEYAIDKLQEAATMLNRDSTI